MTISIFLFGFAGRGYLERLSDFAVVSGSFFSYCFSATLPEEFFYPLSVNLLSFFLSLLFCLVSAILSYDTLLLAVFYFVSTDLSCFFTDIFSFSYSSSSSVFRFLDFLESFVVSLFVISSMTAFLDPFDFTLISSSSCFTSISYKPFFSFFFSFFSPFTGVVSIEIPLLLLLFLTTKLSFFSSYLC